MQCSAVFVLAKSVAENETVFTDKMGKKRSKVSLAISTTRLSLSHLISLSLVMKEQKNLLSRCRSRVIKHTHSRAQAKEKIQKETSKQ